MTVKYSESVRVSESTLRVSGLVCSIMKYVAAKRRRNTGTVMASASIARTAECGCRMIARTW